MKQKQGLQKIEEIIKLSKADIHIHTNYSDGEPTVEELLAYIEAETDLAVIAITDHDTVAGAKLAHQMTKEKEYRFEVIIGEEVTSLEGHILGLFLTHTIPAGLSAHQVLKEIHAQGGIAIASHPFEHSRLKNPNLITMDGVGAITLIKERHHFDGVEVVNGTPTLASQNFRAALLNGTILGLAETGSSDAHIKEAVGRAYTLFQGQTTNDFKRELLNRQTQAMHPHWTIMALLKYLYFFIPKGVRLVTNTIIHGRLPKRNDLY